MRLSSRIPRGRLATAIDLGLPGSLKQPGFALIGAAAIGFGLAPTAVATTYVVDTAAVTLERSTISGNVATRLGGGIDVRRALNFSANHSLVRGTSTYDPVAGGGGGIALEYVKNTAYVNDSTIYGNYAYDNGGGVGIFDASGSTAFNGVTIANNSTYNFPSNGILGAGSTSLYNCIVASNFSHTSTQDLAGAFSENYSLIRTPGTAAAFGFNNRNGEDPQLGLLAVNGGPTLTMLPAPTSPALDAGGLLLVGTDQRGLPRSANGRRDMGAVERQYPEDIIFRDGFDSS